MSEIKVISPLMMDRSEAIGNSLDVDSRRALHTLIKNTNPIPVTTDPTANAAISVFQTAAAVANGVSTSVLTYTVPAGKILQLSAIQLEGDNVAAFTISQNATPIARARFGWTTYMITIPFEATPTAALNLAAGITVGVTVLQESRKTAGNYSARLIGVLIDAP